METQKAGCILLNKENKSIAICYRDKQRDYSFPKGHLERGESLVECAIRETAEETKRVAVIIDELEPYVERYTTPRGEKCVVYYYFAMDGGKSDNTSLDTHETHWVKFDDVEHILTYQSHKDLWNKVRDKLYKYIAD